MMKYSTVISSGIEIPKQQVLTSEMLQEARFDDINLVEKSLGITTVRHARVSLPSELATPAARKAITKCGIDPSEIGALIYCGIERDCSEPATAHIIASNLGLRPSICFDVSNACLGFGSGIMIANALIKTEETQYILLVTAELSSKVSKQVIEMFRCGELNQNDISTHLGAFTVGDAAGCMILGPAEDKGVIHIQSRSESKYHNLCRYDNNNEGKLSFSMEMAKICAKTLKLCSARIRPTYEALQWTPEDVDLFIPHQVGKRIFKKSLQIVNVPESKSISTFEKLGNLASATLPVCFDMLSTQQRLQKNKKLLMTATGSGIAATFIGIQL